MTRFELKSFASDIELAKAAAIGWAQLIADDYKRAHQHTVALSGGRIASEFFKSSVEQIKAGTVPAGAVHLFWADERCVPPTSPESNYFTAKEALIRPLGIPQENVHRLRGELREAAVQQAISDFEKVVARNATGDLSLDLVVLGMGEDGHVASLVPGAPDHVLNCREPFLFITNSPKPPPERVSMSYATIAAAKQVWVLASGKGKTDALRHSLAENATTPLGRVVRSRTHTKIFTDVTL